MATLLSWSDVGLPDRCVDLNEDHIDEGLRSIDAMRTLLKHLARIAKPDEGGAKILVAISRLATTSCEWLDGKLYVEVNEILGAAEIAVSTDLGGVRELVFPRLLVAVPFDELVRAVKLAPRLVTPLKFRVRGERMILKRDIEGTVAPPAFEIAEECLRRSLPPKLRRSLAPIASLSAGAMKQDTSIEAAILARVLPKAAARPLVIDDLSGLDVGWDFGAYSSTVNTRETKPPPPARTPSRMPTHAPPASEASPPEEVPKPPRAPRVSKAPPKLSKRPPKQATVPPKAKPRGRPVIRKITGPKAPKPPGAK